MQGKLHLSVHVVDPVFMDPASPLRFGQDDIVGRPAYFPQSVSWFSSIENTSPSFTATFFTTQVRPFESARRTS